MPKLYTISSIINRTNHLDGAIKNKAMNFISPIKELLDISEGTTFNIEVNVYDEDTSTAADLSYFSCSFFMANSKTQLVKECVIDANKIKIVIKPDDTIGHKYFNFEIRANNDTTGDSYIITEGNIKIKPSIGVLKQRETVFSKPGEYSHIADGGVIGTPSQINVIEMDGGEI